MEEGGRLLVICGKCGNELDEKKEKIKYELGFDVRYLECEYCGSISILEFVEEYIDINNDERYYR